MDKQKQIHEAKLHASLIALGFSINEADYVIEARKIINAQTLCSELEKYAHHARMRLGSKSLQQYFDKVVNEYDKLLNGSHNKKQKNEVTILDAMISAEKDIIEQAKHLVSSKKSVLENTYKKKKSRQR